MYKPPFDTASTMDSKLQCTDTVLETCDRIIVQVETINTTPGLTQRLADLRYHLMVLRDFLSPPPAPPPHTHTLPTPRPPSDPSNALLSHPLEALNIYCTETH